MKSLFHLVFFIILIFAVLLTEKSQSQDEITVTGLTRLDNKWQIDFYAAPGLTGLIVKGSTELANWPDDLTGATTISERFPGSYQAVVDLTGKPAGRYFLQITGTVFPTNTAPTLLPPGDRQIAPGTAFGTTLFATDPDVGDTLTFSLLSGPAGMTLDPVTGKLAWTPAAVETGTHTVNVRVEDEAGASDSGEFAITLTIWPAEPAVRHAPVLTLPANAILAPGAVFAGTASAADEDPGDVLTYALLAGPGGLTLDPATGAIAWTPAEGDAGPHTVTVQVMDQTGLFDLESFTVTVRLANRAPVAVNDLYATPKGETTTVPAPGVMTNDTDPDGDVLTAALVENVKHGTLNFRPDGSFDYRPGIAGIQAKLAYSFRKLGPSDYKVNEGNAPIAADLNGDGKPEIITVGQVNNGIGNTGWLVAMTYDEAATTLVPLWAFKGGVGSPVSIYNSPDPAVGDVNGDGKPEVVLNGQCKGEILIFSNTGELLVNTQADKSVGPGTLGGADCYVGGSHPPAVLADLDGDGAAEIITQYRGTRLRVYNGQGGVVWERLSGAEVNNISAGPLVADLDLDGKLNIYYAGILFDAEGNTIWTLPGARSNYGDRILAVANLDDDPFGEIVISTGRNPNTLRVIEHDGTCKWGAVKTSNPVAEGCGTPKPFPHPGGPQQKALLIADVNGDGLPEIIAASAESTYNHVTVFTRDGDILWQAHPAIGGNTIGSLDVAAFDFDGDGIMEIVAAGSSGTAFLSGIDGSNLFAIPADANNPGGALDAIVADIENDGHAELLIGSRAGVFVYKDVNDRWMPTRPVWNQSEYSITNVNADGTIPRKPAINWLTPGLNNFGVNMPIPGELINTDSFTYKISDGALESNVATVTLDMSIPNRPPVILSSPPTAAVPDFNYRYHVFATDPDVEDTVKLSLLKGPAGMTLDAEGVLRWNPLAANPGGHTVVIGATDRQDAVTLQTYTLRVIDAQPVPDVTGQPQADAVTALEAAGFAGGRITQGDHPTVAAGRVISQTPAAGASERPGTAVALFVSVGPGPGNTDADEDGFTPNDGDHTDDNPDIHPGADDPEGDGIDQNCDGVDGSLILASIIVEPVSPRILAGRNVPLKATGVFTDGTSQNLTAAVTWSTGGPQFSSSTAGEFTVTATRGAITGSTIVTVIGQLADTAPPQAEITSPAPVAGITAPVEVRGTAQDASFLKYELALAPAGTQEFTTIKNGNEPVTNGVLGTLDPTMLINGQYILRLTVYDRGRNESMDETTVLVEENMKVGNFALTFTDLQLPLSGLPITVSRTYDSRNKRRGDFGTGWDLGVNTLKIHTSRTPGTGWQVVKQGLAYGLLPSDVHAVVLTLPDGRLEAFDVAVSPGVSPLVPFPPSTLNVSFVPHPGTRGKLESMENNTVSIFDLQPGPVELLDDVTLEVYNPRRFRYTAPDGTVIVLHTVNGVESIREPNGNTLTLSSGGIFHSSGKSVIFERDDFGRIISISEPGGGKQHYTYDGNGDLRTHTDAGGNVTRYAYNRSHGLLRIVDPLNRQVARNEYDDAGRLIRVTAADGRVIGFAHDVNTRQEVITDAAGRITVMEYDDRGNVVRKTDARGGVTNNTYDGDGNLLTTTNPEGETVTRTFDGRRNLLTEKDSLGNTRVFTYDAGDRVTSVADPLGRITAYKYSETGNLLETAAPGGVVIERNEYDAKGNLAVRTDARGYATRYEYDSSGNQTAVIDPGGARQTIQYNTRGDMVVETDRNGRHTRTTVDARGHFTEKTDPIGNVSKYTFNPVGVMSAVQDALGNETRQEVDAAGRDISITEATGYVRQKTYDTAGNVASTPNSAGHPVRYEYDELSRPVRTINPDGGIARQEYDGAGRVTRTVDALGNETLLEYDDAGRNTKRTDALGRITLFEWDAASNLISQTDARGTRVEFDYDAMNRRVRTRFPDGTFTLTGYDAAGNMISETDAAGRTTLYAWDASGQITEVTDPAGGRTRFTYDAEGNLLTQTDANGNTTRFRYDANGRQVMKIYPDGTREAQSYDAGGRIGTVTDARGRDTRMVYDPAGRLLMKVFPDGTSETFSYTAAGQLASATNATGTVQYTRDACDRLISVTNADGSSIACSYDLNGNRTSVVTKLPGGNPRATATAYDKLDRVAAVTDPDGEVTRYTYDEAGNVATITYPNGVVSTFTYNVLNRLTLLEHRRGDAVLASYSYTLNAAGDRIKVVSAGGSRVEFEYDALRRLTKESHFNALNVKAAEWRYTYDAVGNRKTAVDPAGVETAYTYDGADRLLSAGATTYSYDASGNLVSKKTPSGTASYRFNTESELTGAVVPGAAVTYAYDANGERVRTITPGNVNHHLVDNGNATGVSQVLADYGPSGTPLAEYTYGNELISQRRGSEIHHYHRDGSRNVRLLSDENGSVSDTYLYNAFGERLDHSGETVNPYQFAGDRSGEIDGLTFLRARYYDPATGRFISKDPFEGVLNDPVSLHRYLYANANPVVFSDPTGNYTVTETQVAMAISVEISLITSYFSGDSAGEAIGKAIFSAAFAGIGGKVGSAAANRVLAYVSGKVTSQMVSAVARQWIVGTAVVVTKAAVSSLISLVNTVANNIWDRKSASEIFNLRKLGGGFIINLFVEAVSFGMMPPSQKAAIRDNYEFLVEGDVITRDLLDGFRKSGAVDIVGWLKEIRYYQIFSGQLARIESLAFLEITEGFAKAGVITTDKGKIIFKAFMRAMKSAISKAVL